MGDVTGRLEKRLEQRLGARFQRGVSVGEVPSSPNVIISTPAYSAAVLLEREAPGLSRLLREVQYAPIVTVTLDGPAGAVAGRARDVVRRAGPNPLRQLHGPGLPARDDREEPRIVNRKS